MNFYRIHLLTTDGTVLETAGFSNSRAQAVEWARAYATKFGVEYVYVEAEPIV